MRVICVARNRESEKRPAAGGKELTNVQKSAFYACAYAYMRIPPHYVAAWATDCLFYTLTAPLTPAHRDVVLIHDSSAPGAIGRHARGQPGERGSRRRAGCADVYKRFDIANLLQVAIGIIFWRTQINQTSCGQLCNLRMRYI